MSELFDLRSARFREVFAQSLPIAEYVATGNESQQAKWKGYESRVSLTSAHRELLGTFSREMNVLVLSGIWCGDCARQGPMLALLETAAPSIKVRFVENDVCPDVRDELRIHGASRVPVVVTLSEDFLEMNRFGDRTLAAYRRKAVQELGPACDAGIVPPTTEELALEMDDWVRHFERLHLMLRLSPFLRKRHGD